METILTATDFSAASSNAVAYAAAFANSINAKLVLFNAYHVPLPSGEVPIVIYTPQELEGDVMKKMEGIKKHLLVNYPTLTIEIDFTPGFAKFQLGTASRISG